MIDTYCETCGKQFRARSLTVVQCADHVGQPVVQDEVKRLQELSDSDIYAVKREATIKLRTLQGDKLALWRTVTACNRILARRELPLIPLGIIDRIKKTNERKLVHRGE